MRILRDNGFPIRCGLKFFLIVLVLIALLFAGLFIWTSAKALDIESNYPPVGQFVGSNGKRTHFVDVPAGTDAKLPPVLFVHGASGNLNDQMFAFRAKMEGRARLLFIDRPGHGYSDRGGAGTPELQAKRYKLLLDDLGIEKVVLVGHSLGSASIAAFAVLFPERVKGLVFLAPATHTWPGGVTWYYEVASLPIIGHVFTETLSLPFGMAGIEAGTASVFEPQEVTEGYVEKAAIPLVFRPEVFRNNARDVTGLKAEVEKMSPRYTEIKAPTVVITGDSDDIVLASIHSVGLERDIEGAELIILPGVGHKPDYVATDVAIEAIEKVAK